MILGVSVFAMVAGWSQPPYAEAAPKVIKWKMQSVDPPALIGPQVTQKGFCERVKRMSNGRLDISLFTAGQLVPTREIVEGLARGMIQISYTYTGYYQGAIPEGTLTLSAMPPMLLPTVQDALQVYWYQGVDDIITEAFAEHGVHHLGSLFLGEAITHWSRKPMPTLASMKGHKARAFGYISKVMAKVGASPTFLPHEEVYTSMAQGVIDGSFTAGSYYKRLKYYEICPNFYMPGWIPICSMNLLASAKAWKELPDDLKAIVEEAHRTLAVDHLQRTFWDFQKIMQEFPKLGVNVITWPEEELAKLRKASLSFLPEIASKSERSARAVKIIEDYMKMRGYLK
jgi:TRAP-type mannitol/chloroaromatic compound transport system substrate-binding protein